MSSQGLEIIDHASQTTHEWVSELAGRLDWVSKRSALRLLRVTLHEIRDHLQVDELAHFSAQLPLLSRGMMFEGWVPKRTPSKVRSQAGFIKVIEDNLGPTDDYRGAQDIAYVFLLLNAHLSEGEIADVRANLPSEIRDLWPIP